MAGRVDDGLGEHALDAFFVRGRSTAAFSRRAQHEIPAPALAWGYVDQLAAHGPFRTRPSRIRRQRVHQRVRVDHAGLR